MDVTIVNVENTNSFIQSASCPKEYPEYVMERMFYGSSIGCDCLGVSHRYITDDNTMVLHERCTRNQTIYGCAPVEPMMPFGMHRFENKMICGRRGGQPFLNATRPELSGNCPEGTLKCSNATSLENTVCYDQSQRREDVCPITKFEFFDLSDKVKRQNALNFTDKVGFAFSRDHDALPAVQIQVENQVCMDPYEQQN